METTNAEVEQDTVSISVIAHTTVWALLLLGSTALFVSSLYRAATFPVVHDESLSYAIFNWDPGWASSANNHLLNTFLMKWCSRLMGTSELSLRLPNVLAHAIFLLSSVVFLNHIKDLTLRLVGFVMLNLNPFLLDFFTLARGYGLALGFEMLSLCLLVHGYEKKRCDSGFTTYLLLSAVAGVLAVAANLAFLDYCLPLLVACGWLLLTDTSHKALSLRHWRAAAALSLISGTPLAFLLARVVLTQPIGTFCGAGGQHGFIADTITSLVRCSQYSSVYSVHTSRAISAIVIASLVMLFIIGLSPILLRKRVPFASMINLMLIVAVALPILQFNILKIPFPVERFATFYLPIYAVAVLGSFDLLSGFLIRKWQMAVLLAPALVISGILSWHFEQSFSTHFCFTWGYDAHNTDILEIVDHDRREYFPGKTIAIDISWEMEPSLNFYRITRNHSWLAPLVRSPISGDGKNYIYGYEHDIQKISTDRCTKLASFPDIQTALFRVDPVLDEQ